MAPWPPSGAISAPPGGGGWRWHAAALAAYALGLGAKATIVTLPAVLVLLDVYPLRRLPADGRWWSPAARRLWAEKLPYAALGAAAGTLALHARTTKAAFELLAPGAALGKLAYGLWFTTTRTLLPVGLSPLYELPPAIDPLAPRFAVAGLGVLALSVVALGLRRRSPAVTAAWVYTILAQAPTLAPAQSGPQLTADRYTYLASLGGALLLGGLATEVATRARDGRLRQGTARLLAGAAVLALLGLGALTWGQVAVWRTTETVWRHAVTVDPGCSFCHVQLGVFHVRQGALATAAAHFTRAVALRPEHREYRYRLADVLGRLERWSEAAATLRPLVDTRPASLGLRVDLALTLARAARPADAVAVLAGALDHGRPDGVAASFRKLVETHPSAAALAGLALAEEALGRTAAARAAWAALQARDPGLAAALAPYLGLKP